jgi:SAM-dependent methyltransferase
MLELAVQNLHEAGLDNVEFHQGDAEQLTLGDASVDRALCSAGLMDVPDPTRVLAEVARVLVTGGRFVATVPGLEGTNSLLSAALDDANEPLTLDYRYLVRLSDAELLEGLARDAGFAKAVATLESRSMQITDPATWWDMFRESAGLFSGLLAELSPDGAARSRASFIERCAPYRAGDGFALPQGMFYLVAER